MGFSIGYNIQQPWFKMPTLHDPFHDRAQPEYLFVQFFTLEVDVPFVKERTKQFLIKMPLIMMGLVLMRFFVYEVMPPILGMILMAVLYFLVIYLLVKYFMLVNKMAKSSSIFGLVVCIFILVALVLVM